MLANGRWDLIRRLKVNVMATPWIMRFAVSGWSLKNTSKYYCINSTYSFDSVTWQTMFKPCLLSVCAFRTVGVTATYIVIHPLSAFWLVTNPYWRYTATHMNSVFHLLSTTENFILKVVSNGHARRPLPVCPCTLYRLLSSKISLSSFTCALSCLHACCIGFIV